MTAPHHHPQPFHISGPLPGPGLTAIEASAGTGKTYAIAALATRFVVEGTIDIADLLVVTFTRAAAGELRERIRQRLTGVVDHLQHNPPPATSDPLLTMFGNEPPDTRHEYLRRARSAVSHFDNATIGTIHGFCSAARSLLGTAGGTNPDSSLTSDVTTIVTATCTDVLAAASLQPDPGELPSSDELASAVGALIANPAIELWTTGKKEKDTVCMALAAVAVAQVRDRLHAAGLLTFDTMVTELRDALTGSADNAGVLARHFPVVLIDEFQDTDDAQWGIFSAMLDADADHTTVVVGDPKQAIYAFRGGDVQAYLAATNGPDVTRLFLDTNHRCDAPMVTALNTLFDDQTFGDPRIAYLTVQSSGTTTGRLMVDDGPNGSRTPLPSIEIRCVDPTTQTLTTNQPAVSAPDATRANHEDLAGQIAHLLRTGWLEDPGADSPPRRLEPSDVAVLVSGHAQSPSVQAALRRFGVEAVIVGGQSITETEAARQWSVLLAALAQPGNTRRARAATLSWWWGWSEADLVAASDRDLANVHQRLQRWSTLVRRSGVSPLMAEAMASGTVAARLLADPDGLRNLPDLNHLAELLDEAAEGGGVSPTRLAATLTNLRTAASTPDDDDAHKRRSATDAKAVRIMTMHAAKGLEFPVVCCPELWRDPQKTVTPVSHLGTTRRFRIGTAGGKDDPDGFEADMAERKRLTYVALTRARHHTIMWWTRGQRRTSASIDLLFGHELEKGNHDPLNQALGYIQTLADRFADPAQGIRVTKFEPPTPPCDDATEAGSPEAGDPEGDISNAGAPALAAALIERPDRGHIRRWSFTTISSGGSHPAHSEAGDPDDDSLGDTGSSDEAVAVVTAGANTSDPEPNQPQPDDTTALAPLFADDAAGATFGTLVHEVLERVDFTGDNDIVSSALHHEVQRTRLDTITAAGPLVNALQAALATPLGGPPAHGFGNLSLSDVSRNDRLDELRFELPLGDHTAPHPNAALAADKLMTVVRSHLDHNDPMARWAQGFGSRAQTVRLGGYLTGSIDLVLRHRHNGTTRFSAIDYKTNRLSAPGASAPLSAYDPRRLPDAMASHDYPLQALLYAVALHRYLRWRLADYDPAVHLGPVGYLFLRGMVGPKTPEVDGARFGVFVWQPPTAMVTDLSDLLHDGVTP